MRFVDMHDHRPRRIGKVTVSVGAALAVSGLAHWLTPVPVEYPLPPGVPHVVSTAGERAVIDLPASVEGAQYLLVVSNLARTTDARLVELTSEPIDRVEHRPTRRVERLNVTPLEIDTGAAPNWSSGADAPQRREFWLHVGGGSYDNPATHRRIATHLAASGRRVRVYLDDDDRVPAATVRTIVDRFDRAVLPTIGQTVGWPRDVDGDGAFTIVLTSWLSRLDGENMALGGLVRPGDFVPSAGAPFSNAADVLFLNAGLRPGDHLETLLAHELAHAVNSSRREAPWPFFSYPSHEAAWLSEAIAHVAENLHGDNFSNLDYRVASYLADPAASPLVVDDYQAAGLYRDSGVRGCAYLFLRWCVAQYGAGMLSQLAQGSRTGVENVEAATGESFDELFRRFTVAQFADTMQAGGGGDVSTRRDAGAVAAIDTMRPLGGWGLAGPRVDLWDLHDAPASVRRRRIVGTATACFRVLAGREPRRIELSGEPGCQLQVTLVRLPDEAPGAQLDVVAAAEGGYRLVLSQFAGTGPLRLTHVAWSAVSDATPRAERPAHRLIRGAELEQLFGETELRSEGQLTSRAVDFHDMPQGRVAIAVVAEDDEGRRVAAWAELDLRRAVHHLASRR